VDFAPNSVDNRPVLHFILADLYSGLVHKLHCNRFSKCNLCGNITTSVNRMLTQAREAKKRKRQAHCSQCLKYWKKNINIELGVGVYMNVSLKGTEKF